MPPILIALGVVAAYFLIPKSQRTGSNTIVTTGSQPVGINAFPAPAISRGGRVKPATGATANIPNPSGSGVPTSAPQVQQVAASTPPAQPASPFYGYPKVLAPNYVPTAVPQSTPASSGCGGKCGGCASKGSCSGASSAGASDCSITTRRAAGGGCLAPTANSLINKKTIPALNNWMANLASYPMDAMQTTMQDLMYTVQNNNPSTDDVTPPIGSTSTHVGLSNRNYNRGF